MSSQKQPTVCVVGSGVSGLVCAYLLSKEYAVTLVESAAELGMDSSSRDVDNARVDVPLRTFSEDYYQNLTKIYKEIGVEYAAPDYSFCCYYKDEPAHFRYKSWVRNWFTFGLLGIEKLTIPGTRLSKLPRCLSHIYEYWNFMRVASKKLQDPNNGLDKISFKEYVLSTHSSEFYHEMLLPMLSVICTCTHDAVSAYPAEVLVDYLAGRAMLYPMGSNPQRAVSGTRDVVHRLSSKCARVITNSKVTSVIPQPGGGVKVTWTSCVRRTPDMSPAPQETCMFDQVIIATQANAALEVLGASATDLHRRALGSVRYERNRTVLHTDETVLPMVNDRAVCNLGIDKAVGRSDCTIWMNKVDPTLGAKFHRNVFQTWNPLVEPDKSKVLFDTWFERPVMTVDSAAHLDVLAEIQGKDNLWFIGAYSLYSMPLLENGTRSAIRIANRLLKSHKVPEVGRQISGANFERRRPDLVAMCGDEIIGECTGERHAGVVVTTTTKMQQSGLSSMLAFSAAALSVVLVWRRIASNV